MLPVILHHLNDGKFLKTQIDDIWKASNMLDCMSLFFSNGIEISKPNSRNKKWIKAIYWRMSWVIIWSALLKISSSEFLEQIADIGNTDTEIRDLMKRFQQNKTEGNFWDTHFGTYSFIPSPMGIIDLQFVVAIPRFISAI